MTYEAPDYVEPFEGWRVWRVVRVDGTFRLGSIVQHTVWPITAELPARCERLRLFRRRRRRHEAPQLGCECGIYAASTVAQLRMYLADGLHGLSRVLGQVALWGTVVECERGFRASHAYPTRLFVPDDAGMPWRTSATEIALALCAYGVPVEPLAAPAAQAPDLLSPIRLRPAR
jgi:hypothetical protein